MSAAALWHGLHAGLPGVAIAPIGARNDTVISVMDLVQREAGKDARYARREARPFAKSSGGPATQRHKNGFRSERKDPGGRLHPDAHGSSLHAFGEHVLIEDVAGAARHRCRRRPRPVQPQSRSRRGMVDLNGRSARAAGRKQGSRITAEAGCEAGGCSRSERRFACRLISPIAHFRCAPML